jgi:hypothetical protein
VVQQRLRVSPKGRLPKPNKTEGFVPEPPITLKKKKKSKRLRIIIARVLSIDEATGLNHRIIKQSGFVRVRAQLL